MDTPDFRTREEAAARARCSRDTIDNAVKRGDLEVVKAGRRVLIPTESLEKWLTPRGHTAKVVAS